LIKTPGQIEGMTNRKTGSFQPRNAPLQQWKIAVLPLEVIRNHSKSGLLGSEFRLPFGELLVGDFAGLFRINLREPSF